MGDPDLSWPRPFPAGQGSAASSYALQTVNSNLRDGYTQQWNLAVERELWRTSIDRTYDLPVGKGRWLNFGDAGAGKFGRVLDHAFGGWSTSAFWKWYNAVPFTPTYSGSDPSSMGLFSGQPDRIGSGEISNPNEYRWFDASAFRAPAANIGWLGNSGRNILSAPNLQRFTLAVFKNFNITEKVSLRFNGYLYNPFNQHSWRAPNANISDTVNVGRLRSLDPATFNWTRQIQLGARLSF